MGRYVLCMYEEGISKLNKQVGQSFDGEQKGRGKYKAGASQGGDGRNKTEPASTVFTCEEDLQTFTSRPNGDF